MNEIETKADWLRSEIEKLEIERNSTLTSTDEESAEIYGIRLNERNTAFTTIITRYKEELKELESK